MELAEQLADEVVQAIKAADGSYFVCLLHPDQGGLSKNFELDYTLRGYLEFLEARDGKGLRFILSVNDPVKVMTELKELVKQIVESALERQEGEIVRLKSA